MGIRPCGLDAQAAFLAESDERLATEAGFLAVGQELEQAIRRAFSGVDARSELGYRFLS